MKVINVFVYEQNTHGVVLSICAGREAEETGLRA